tara:strand:+ start:135 stop:476 length:342 start_codon:yes stop_codon:yes gene_type:complete
MQTCQNCGHGYNEFTSGTPASEEICDDCAPLVDAAKEPNKREPLSSKEQNLLRGKGWQGVTPKIACPNCGSKNLEGWTAGGQKGFTCATCGHDQTTQIDDTTYHRKHADKRSS